ncbi:hypothetical protein HEP_00454600, partial [Hepatocystis sp. ex Piliocolobus tephrosceles]
MEDKMNEVPEFEKNIQNMEEYIDEGNVLFESEELKNKRENIKNDKIFIDCVKNIWMNILNKKMDERFSKIEYFKIMLRICKVLIPQFEIKKVINIVSDEWNNDSKGKKYLDFNSFFNAFFELADIWTPTIDAYDYAHFLKSLFYRIILIEVTTESGEVIKKKPIFFINFKRNIKGKKKLSLLNDSVDTSPTNKANDNQTIDDKLIESDKDNFLNKIKSIKRLSVQLKQLKKQFSKRLSAMQNTSDSFLYVDGDDKRYQTELGRYDGNIFESILNKNEQNTNLKTNVVLLDVDEINPMEYDKIIQDLDEGEEDSKSDKKKWGSKAETDENAEMKSANENERTGTYETKNKTNETENDQWIVDKEFKLGKKDERNEEKYKLGTVIKTVKETKKEDEKEEDTDKNNEKKKYKKKEKK